MGLIPGATRVASLLPLAFIFCAFGARKQDSDETSVLRKVSSGCASGSKYESPKALHARRRQQARNMKAQGVIPSAKRER